MGTSVSASVARKESAASEAAFVPPGSFSPAKAKLATLLAEMDAMQRQMDALRSPGGSAFAPTTPG